MLAAVNQTFQSLKRQAGWQNRGVIAAVTLIIGLLADLVERWFGILAIVFPVLAGLTLVLFLAWWSAQTGARVRLRKWLATLSLNGIIATLALAPIAILNFSVGSERGAASTLIPGIDESLRRIELAFEAEIDELEETVNEGFEETRTAIAEQGGATRETIAEEGERTREDLGELENTVREGNEVTLEAVTETRAVLEFSQALEIDTRARQARDGSNQGQVQALASLHANDFDFVASDYSGVRLAGLAITGADFCAARFAVANLSGVVLRDVTLDDADLRFADIEGADFSGAGSSLTSLSAPFLSGKGARFINADLSRSTFVGADLRNADFSYANLSNTSFAFADLTGANFEGADLTGAHFVYAQLGDARFEGARFDNTNMLAAFLDADRLSASQQAGACKHRLDERSTLTAEIVETFPDPDGRGGQGSERSLSARANGNRYPVLDEPTLPECASAPDNTDRFTAIDPMDEPLAVARTVMRHGDRRAQLRAQLDRPLEAMYAAIDDGRPIYASPTDFLEDALDEITLAARRVTTLERAYFDEDMVFALLVGRGGYTPDPGAWQQGALARHRLERRVDQVFEAKLEAHSYWSRFFVDERITVSDAPDAITQAFQTYTERRASRLPQVFTFRPGAWEHPDSRGRETLQTLFGSVSLGGLNRTLALAGQRPEQHNSRHRAAAAQLAGAPALLVDVPAGTLARQFTVFASFDRKLTDYSYDRADLHEGDHVELDARLTNIERAEIDDPVFLMEFEIEGLRAVSAEGRSRRLPFETRPDPLDALNLAAREARQVGDLGFNPDTILIWLVKHEIVDPDPGLLWAARRERAQIEGINMRREGAAPDTDEPVGGWTRFFPPGYQPGTRAGEQAAYQTYLATRATQISPELTVQGRVMAEFLGGQRPSPARLRVERLRDRALNTLQSNRTSDQAIMQTLGDDITSASLYSFDVGSLDEHLRVLLQIEHKLSDYGFETSGQAIMDGQITLEVVRHRTLAATDERPQIALVTLRPTRFTANDGSVEATLTRE